jgi:ATP-binding cassette, subfamily B, bacterial
MERAKHRRYVGDFVTKAKRSWNFQNQRIDMLVSPIYVATNVIGLAIVLHLGVDTATKAALFLAFSYYANVTRFLWSFNSVYRRLEEAITDASLFVNYILTPPKVVDSKDASRLKVHDGFISFRDVLFTHPENSDALFHNFSLDIKPGQKVGLVGHSGAGKSTIVNLLLRFMNIDGGSIQIDGQDIAHVTQKSLHQAIAFVPQEPLLFHRSLRENIAYGKPHATGEEILDAARQAHALEFIEKLPEGFDTLVGERGVKLSGGQRQRVAIARAILKDAPILVLDEATSALDSESEKLIQDALARLMKGRTSIVIAHRLSTIAKLDRIIVLENGKVAEDGSHVELLKNNGIYAKLWNHQSGGFIEE